MHILLETNDRIEYFKPFILLLVNLRSYNYSQLRTGLVAVLVLIRSGLELKPNRITEVEVRNKS